MSGITFSNNQHIIIITNPNEIPGLSDAINNVVRNDQHLGNRIVENIRRIENSGRNNNVRNNIDLSNNNVHNNSQLSQNNAQIMDNNEIAHNNNQENHIINVNSEEDESSEGSFENSQIITYVPQREVYVLKTNVKNMIYTLFENIEDMSKLQYFIAYKSKENGVKQYYVLIKFGGRKKISKNNFRCFTLIDKVFTLSTAIAFCKSKGREYFIPKETLSYPREINDGFAKKGKVKTKEKIKISKINDLSSANSWRLLSGEKEEKECESNPKKEKKELVFSPIRKTYASSDIFMSNYDSSQFSKNGPLSKFYKNKNENENKEEYIIDISDNSDTKEKKGKSDIKSDEDDDAIESFNIKNIYNVNNNKGSAHLNLNIKVDEDSKPKEKKGNKNGIFMVVKDTDGKVTKYHKIDLGKPIPNNNK